MGPTKPLENAQGFAPVLFPPDPQCLEQRLVQSRGFMKIGGTAGADATSASDCKLPGARGAAIPALCR